MHETFCAQIPILLEMIAEHDKYTRRTHQVFYSNYNRPGISFLSLRKRR